MDNHYNLLIKTPPDNLPRAMRHIDGIYTQHYNRLENRDGSLFRGRYKAILIDAENYLVAVNRYIHKCAAQAFGSNKSEMRVNLRGKSNNARSAAIFLACGKYGYSLNDVSKTFAISYSGISIAARRFEKIWSKMIR